MRKQSRIHTVVIAGPGIMGASFAQIFAKWYDRVYLYGVSESSLEKADYLISINQKSQVEQGALTQEESRALLERITMTTSKDCFAQADFVLEAIPRRWMSSTPSGKRSAGWWGRMWCWPPIPPACP